MSRDREWCGLTVVPVYPYRIIWPPGTVPRHPTRRVIRNGVAGVHPGVLSEFRFRNLRRLRAVVALPRFPRPDLIGTPVPALSLDRYGPFRTALASGVVYAETSRGYDRYVVTRDGLVECGHFEGVPEEGKAMRCSGKARGVRLRGKRRRSSVFHPADFVAVVGIVVAMILRLTFAQEAVGDVYAPPTDVSVPGVPRALSTTGHGKDGLGQVLTTIMGSFPAFRVHTISRDGPRLVLTGRFPVNTKDIASFDKEILTDLAEIFDVHLERGDGEIVIHLEGVSR